MTQNIIIIGASGFIGSHIFSSLKKGNQKKSLVFGTFNRSINKHELLHLDFTKKQEISSFIEKWKPSIIIVCSGIKDIKLCEDNYDLAYSLNTQPIIDLIDIIDKKNQNTHIIFLSTDYIFSGDSGFYSDTDIPNPVTNYGKTKYLAELALFDSNVQHTIIRTSAVLGTGSNFFDWITQKLMENQEVELFEDIFFSPTPINLIVYVINVLLQTQYDYNHRIIHISGNERISRYIFGCKIKSLMDSKSVIKPILGLSISHLFQHDLSLLPSTPYVQLANRFMEDFYKSIYDSSH